MRITILTKALEENKIDGGEIMQSLAQTLRNERKEIWIKEGKKEGIKEGEKEHAKKVAMNMLHDNCPIEIIKRYSGLTEQEIRALMS